MSDDIMARLELTAKVYESTDSPTDAYVARTLREAKVEIERLRAASRWMLHIIHGVGKAGGSPEPGELENAVKSLHDALGEPTNE